MNPWQSIILVSKFLRRDRPIGILYLSEFGRMQGTNGEWKTLVQTWSGMKNEMSHCVPTGVMDYSPTMMNGKQVSLDWFECPEPRCNGIICDGGCACFRCGGLLVYASRNGTPYVPAHSRISGARTGLATQLSALKPPPKPTVLSTSGAVSLIRHLRVFNNQTAISTARMLLKDLHKSQWCYFRKIAHVSRDAYVVLILKNRHPLCHGDYCDGLRWKGVLRVAEGQLSRPVVHRNGE